MLMRVRPVQSLKGEITVPGDKSISHRAVMLGALAEGVTEISGFLHGEDCLSTIEAFRDLGVTIDSLDETIIVHGVGLDGLKEADDVLNVGNSGTTIRLLSGILAGQKFTTFLSGDASIRKRPMGRVIKPLSLMGAKIVGKADNTLAPLAICGSPLHGITYVSPVASAQVKSAVLLAGLYADGWTTVQEPSLSRNHTELMLAAFGGEVEQLANGARVKGRPTLKGQSIKVPADISSAAYLLVAAAIVPDSRVRLKNVGLNPTRTGILTVLRQMGAKFSVENEQTSGGESAGDILIESSELTGTTISGALIPTLIDEVPIIAVAAAYAKGVTEIRDAGELKVKESNRLETIAKGLGAMGAKIEILDDGLRIYGGTPLKGAYCESFNDHRIAMSLAVAALAAQGETQIEGFEAVNVSWPNFWADLSQLAGEAHD